MQINAKKPKGKGICLALMVLFTLVLIFDIANLWITPARQQMNFGPSDFSGEFSQEFTPPDFGDREAPEGNPFQNQNGQMPEDRPDRGGERQQPPGGSGRGGLLQSIRKAWIPIAVICVLGDTVCLWVLLHFHKKEEVIPEDEETPDDLDNDDEEPAKRKHFPWMPVLCVIVAAAVVLSQLSSEQQAASTTTVNQKVVSGTAEAAQIQTVLSGAGTLEAGSLTAVGVPQQVKVLKYHVRNGENVSAGDSLVSVDKTSASSAMMALSSIIKNLDSDLEQERWKNNAPSISATASGRVKAIYAKTGDRVTDVLYEKGALMLLSLDGLMKVSFESDLSLNVGDPVTVQYEGGEEEGRIASIRQGLVTVTLSDSTAPYGVQATVIDENGKTIGSGLLSINSELKVISYYGTVSTIPVSLNQKVSTGGTLMTVKDTGNTVDYQILLARRSELEAQMQQLSQLSQSGMVYAEEDGIVSGVPDDAEIELLSGSEAPSIVFLRDVQYRADSIRLVTLSEVEPAAETPTAPKTGTVYLAACITAVENGSITVSYTAASSAYDNPKDYADSMGQTGSFTVFKTGLQVGDYVILEVSKTDDVLSSEAKVTNHIPVEREPEYEPVVLNGYYAGSLAQVNGRRVTISLYPTALTDPNVDLSSLQSQMTLMDGFAYSGSTAKNIPLTQAGKTTTVSLSELQANDLMVVSFQSGIITSIVRAERLSSQQPGEPTAPSQGGMTNGMPGGGMPSGGGGFGGSSGQSSKKSYEAYNTEPNELLYISDQQEVSLTITVDELDILSLETGLSAQVTLDAMKGQSFDGTIVRIGHEGVNDGGNTKFSVTIHLSREANMLDGMNASVKITTASQEARVSIPAAALQEDDGKTYVYTAYDAKSDTLSGLTEVETGVSDGKQVEILSGLELGQPYYYRYADSVTYNFLTI